jgi:hypothetical protein
VHRALGDDATAAACHREWRAALTGLGLDERCLRLPPSPRTARVP